MTRVVTGTAADASALTPTVDVLPADGETTAVVLVLPGGKARSTEPGDPAQLAWARMRPFAATLHRRGAGLGVAVWSVRYRYRGWNGDEQSPVDDTRWALDEVRRRHGGVPVVLVGHSMGGRTALAVGGDESVVGVCAMAPWVEGADPVEQLAGRAVFIAHGTADLVTSAPASRRYARRAAAVTSPVGRVLVVGDIHAMLLRWRRWHTMAASVALAMLGVADEPGFLRRAYAAGRRGRFGVPI
jgi:alpha-beta hydrolase superfamily lysophospholipase